jgi:hypothetical protein
MRRRLLLSCPAAAAAAAGLSGVPRGDKKAWVRLHNHNQLHKRDKTHHLY